MREIRNIDNRLVCRIDEDTGTIEIKIKDCTTLIKRNQDGKCAVINTKEPAA